MIVKNVARRKGTSSFVRLGTYVLDHAHAGEKVTLAQVTNCHSDDAHWALHEITATQALNTRSRADRTCHLVASFPAGEVPTPEQLADIEATLVDAIGLADHQRISAVHRNTGHVHLHIAINRVHPQTYRAVNVLRDYYRLDEACRLLEQRHHLQEDNRIARVVKGNTPALPATLAQIQSHTGKGSFLSWLREQAPAIEAARDRATSWPAFHQSLAELGLRLEQRGAGLVFTADAAPGTAKASQLSRNCAMAQLRLRFGPFVPNARPLTHEPAPNGYQPRPLQKHPAAPQLYETYQRERQAAQKARTAFLEQSRAEVAAHRAALARWYTERRDFIRKAHHLTPVEKRLAYRRLAAERKADLAATSAARSTERAKAATVHPLLSWNDFLRRATDNGDLQALEVLRAHEQKGVSAKARLLTAPNADVAQHIVMQGAQRQTRKNGDVIYRLKDGGLIRDTATSVHVEESTAAAAMAALTFAQQRFPDRPLIVQGTAEFRTQVAEIAATHRLPVRFADPQLEALRTAQRSTPSADLQRAALEVYVAARNKFSLPGRSSILYHRIWTPKDAGESLYRGRRQLEGREAVLLERKGEILVMPVTPAQAAKASTWRLGTSVVTDDRGRFRDRSQTKDRE